MEHKRKFFDTIRDDVFCDRSLKKVCHGLNKYHRIGTFVSTTVAEIRNIASRLTWHYFWIAFGIYLPRILKETKTILIDNCRKFSNFLQMNVGRVAQSV